MDNPLGKKEIVASTKGLEHVQREADTGYAPEQGRR